ncbi:MAG: hypothetical protein GYA62_12505 [Bacteroidales bacterium]|nr:hypothetical protein [Bacteroidales bacterium]
MILFNIGYGQSIYLKTSIGITDNELFKTPATLGFGYNQNFKKFEINAELQFSKFKTNSIKEFEFDMINQYMVLCGTSVKTKTYSIEITPLFYIKKNDYVSISLGPTLGASSFDGVMKKYYYPINGQEEKREKIYLDKNIKPSFGFMFKTDIKQIMIKKISMFLIVAPKFYYLHKRVLDGSSAIGPSSIIWTSFGIGLKYDLK